MDATRVAISRHCSMTTPCRCQPESIAPMRTPGPAGQVLPMPAVSPGILAARVVIMSSRLVPRVVAATRPAPARTARRIAYSTTEAPACLDLPCGRRMVQASCPPAPHIGAADGLSWRGFR